MAILSIGNPFGDTDTVTSTKLNNIANTATFDDPVDGTTLEKHTDGKLRIAPTGVGTNQIAPSAVTTAKLAASAVTTAKIEDDAVTTDKIGDDAVTPAKLSAGAPTWSDGGILEYVGNDTAGGLGNTSLTLQASEDAGIDAKLALGVKTGNIPFIGTIPKTGSNSASLAFYTYDVERMRLDNNGTLLVGRSSTQTTSKIRIDNYATNYGYGIEFYGKSGQASFTPLIFRSSSGGAVGSITNGNSSTSYNTSSDYRLKEDIIEMDGSIDRLKALKPCNFRWKSDGTRVDGFIAHEAQEVVPEAVTGTKDAVDEEGNPDYQGIDQAKLVPLLTKALQEAVAKIESLETRVEALENA